MEIGTFVRPEVPILGTVCERMGNKLTVVIDQTDTNPASGIVDLSDFAFESQELFIEPGLGLATWRLASFSVWMYGCRRAKDAGTKKGS